jgi:hypothetical protein
MQIVYRVKDRARDKDMLQHMLYCYIIVIFRVLRDVAEIQPHSHLRYLNRGTRQPDHGYLIYC